mgnify:CR=1 FL=1
MRVIVTGSRQHANRDAVRTALDALIKDLAPAEHLVVVTGACPTGADRWADEWARSRYPLNVRPERHPADWKMGKQAGHWRNQHMVNLGADLVLAFFQPGAQNVGTADCVARAVEAGIPVRRYPQGPTEAERAADLLRPDETPLIQARLDALRASMGIDPTSVGTSASRSNNQAPAVGEGGTNGR